MNNKLQNIKEGDSVFYWDGYGKYPVVVTVERATQNFVFVKFQGSVEYEKKFRRDGSIVSEYRYDHDYLELIGEGEIQKWEKQKADAVRINEIISLLDGKGFNFRGNPQWLTLEQWEAMAAVFVTPKPVVV